MENPSRRTLIGAGLHGGARARLDLTLRDGAEPPGPRLRFPGAGPLASAQLSDLPRRARRSTILGGPRAEIRTPEHLLAALLFFRDQPLDIDCDAPEPPGLDGSALPFRAALAALAPACAAEPAWSEYPCDLEWEHRWDYGHIRLRPAAGFRVRFELDRPPLRQAFVLQHPAVAWHEILPARTFAFHREWKEACANGLMAGADADSGLLLAESEREHGELLLRHPEWAGGPFPLLNQPAWRMEDELAKHKILDLLGDLALLDLALPRAEIEIRNGGHQANHLLVERLAAR